MARSKNTQVIDRSITVNFTQERDDQRLKARLQQLLDNGTFDNKSELAKHFLAKGLDAELAPPEPRQRTSGDVQFAGKVQRQLNDMQAMLVSLTSLMETIDNIDHRTRRFRPTLAEAMVKLLTLHNWSQEEAEEWAEKNMLHKPKPEKG